MDNNKIILPIIFGLLGYFFSTRAWILFMDKLSPFYGLIVYYVILLIVILVLEHAGLVIGNISFADISHTFGAILIVFSFFILIRWESCYVNYVAKGHCRDVSNIYMQSEDGTVYYLWHKLTNNHEMTRLLTYVFTPFILSFIGVHLITDKISLRPF